MTIASKIASKVAVSELTGPNHASTAMSVSVIICAYTEKRWSDLVKAVTSLTQQQRVPDEVIVVIDHNPALLQRFATEVPHFALPKLLLLENSQERGLSGARNSGIAAASGTILAFMDEDAYAAPDWLAMLLPPYADPNVLGVGGTIEATWDAGRPAWFPREFDWVVGCTYLGMPTTQAPVRNLIGCNMSFRHSMVEQVGAFRSGIGRIGTLPVGCEETEYCIRAYASFPQGKFLYAPRARVYHRVPADRGTWGYFRSRCYFEGRSKALVTQLAGATVGLSSERAYTTRVLPQGVLRGLLATITKGDRGGVGRAVAIAVGLLTTVVGYGIGKLRLRSRSARPAPSSKVQQVVG